MLLHIIIVTVYFSNPSFKALWSSPPLSPLPPPSSHSSPPPFYHRHSLLSGGEAVFFNFHLLIVSWNAVKTVVSQGTRDCFGILESVNQNIHLQLLNELRGDKFNLNLFELIFHKGEEICGCLDLIVQWT